LARGARRSILKAIFHLQKLMVAGPADKPGELRSLLAFLRDYCRAIFLSLDHLQRVWGHSGNIERVLLKMYDFLFELFPPLFPAILESTLTEDEIKALNYPLLR
jgi:hypothetical protein